MAKAAIVTGASSGIGGSSRPTSGGAMASVDAVVELWRQHPGDEPRQIVGITSVAAWRGLPGGSPT